MRWSPSLRPSRSIPLPSQSNAPASAPDCIRAVRHGERALGEFDELGAIIDRRYGRNVFIDSGQLSAIAKRFKHLACSLQVLARGERLSHIETTVRADEQRRAGPIGISCGLEQPGRFVGRARAASELRREVPGLREAQEELGIEPEAVRILRALPLVETLTSNYAISAFVGRLGARPALRSYRAPKAAITPLELGVALE